jgi:hypothetical protein
LLVAGNLRQDEDRREQSDQGEDYDKQRGAGLTDRREQRIAAIRIRGRGL